MKTITLLSEDESGRRVIIDRVGLDTWYRLGDELNISIGWIRSRHRYAAQVRIAGLVADLSMERIEVAMNAESVGMPHLEEGVDPTGRL